MFGLNDKTYLLKTAEQGPTAMLANTHTHRNTKPYRENAASIDTMFQNDEREKLIK